MAWSQAARDAAAEVRRLHRKASSSYSSATQTTKKARKQLADYLRGMRSGKEPILMRHIVDAKSSSSKKSFQRFKAAHKAGVQKNMNRISRLYR